MKAKHTRTPGQRRDAVIHAPSINDIARVHSLGMHDPSDVEQRANARLIAAAPDLLATLAQVVAMLDQPVQHSGRQTPATCDILRGDATAARNAARAAIARATGVES